MPLQICLTPLTLVFLKTHAVRSENRYLTSPIPPLTPVILMVCTDHADDNRNAPMSYVRSENLTFAEAERRIDEIAKVIQLAISPPGPEHATTPGTRTWECKVEGEGHHRTSKVVWSASYNPNII